MANNQNRTNKTIETLVKKGTLRREDAGRYYEEKGYYESAIRHYRDSRSYEKAFDLCLRINRLDTARGILKSIDEGISYSERRLIAIDEESKICDWGAMGRAYSYLSNQSTRERLIKLRETLQTKLNNAQKPKQ